MRVVIDIDVANDKASFRWLDVILHRFYDDWHFWAFDEISSAKEMLATAWLQDPGHTGEVARGALRKAVSRSLYPMKLHGKKVRVCIDIDPESTLEFLPEPAARFLDQELVILLENRKSDGDFLDAFVDTLGSGKLKEHWSRRPAPMLKDSLGGKGEIRQHVEQEVEDRKANSDPPPRFFVLCDSDGHLPNEIADDANELLKRCQDRGIPCRILRKKEAENYLPASLLTRQQSDEPEEMRKRLAAWSGLSDEQKDFFDVKLGLKKVSREARQQLFVDLGDQETIILETGFGKKVSSLWKQRPINPDDLRQRAGSELDEILKLLCEYL